MWKKRTRTPEHKEADRSIIASHSLTIIRRGLESYREMFEPTDCDIALASYSQCLRSRKFGVTMIAFLNDGFVLHQATEGWLANYSNRLKLPDGEEPDFHRDAFNVDAQCVYPQPVNLHGVEEIGNSKDALSVVLSMEQDVTQGVMTDWDGFKISSFRPTNC